jgi:hypothetical protein
MSLLVYMFFVVASISVFLKGIFMKAEAINIMIRVWLPMLLVKGFVLKKHMNI